MSNKAKQSEMYRYEGRCKLFVGTEKTINDVNEEFWLLEDVNITKDGLISALKKVGIICEDIEIVETSTKTGQRWCKVTCLYKEKIDLNDTPLDFYLDGLLSYYGDHSCYVVFYFLRRFGKVY